jgi:hypothetical protein
MIAGSTIIFVILAEGWLAADRGCTRVLSYFGEYEWESCWIVDLWETVLGEWKCCWSASGSF